jgi:acetylornithine deacetylase/succinyl-diaminopimelate desuccinylase-like protein
MYRASIVWLAVGVFLVGVLVAQRPTLDSALTKEAIDVLCGYLKIDTSNPPGNELEAALYLAAILDREQIPYEIFEPVPGRATLVARLKGTGERRPLILLQHLDVVPPVEGDEDSFSGEIREGAIWGRGALDMKGLGVVQLMSFIRLKRSGMTLTRDVILIASADEEAGSRLGTAWLLDNYFDRFRDAGLVLTEGGSNLEDSGNLSYVGIEIAQKAPLWLRLSVRGLGGHAALAADDSPVVRLVRALNRVAGYRPALRVEPNVERYFRRIARFEPREISPVFQDIQAAILDPEFDPSRLGAYFQALLQNTMQITVLRAGDVVNSIPQLVWAELDCRLLPGTDPGEFLGKLVRIIDDPAVELEPLLEVHPSRSPEKVELVRAVAQSLEEIGSDAEVGPSVSPGFTDSRLFRERGIPSYGFSPFRHVAEYGSGIHGRNERIAVEDFKFGLNLFSRVLDRLVYSQAPRNGEVISSGR